jgi:hypothetical protein
MDEAVTVQLPAIEQADILYVPVPAVHDPQLAPPDPQLSEGEPDSTYPLFALIVKFEGLAPLATL